MEIQWFGRWDSAMAFMGTLLGLLSCLPACTVSSINSSQIFLWELSSFYLHGLDWVAPPTSQTLAHPHTPPYGIEIVSGRICNTSQVKENMHIPRLWCNCWETGAYFPLELPRYKLGRGVAIFSTPSEKLAWERSQHKGRQILNLEKVK